MKGWQVKLCSLLLILILLTPEIPWREAGAQPATDEERYYRCRAEKCLTYQPTGSMPNNIPYQAASRVGSYRVNEYSIGGVAYDGYGRIYYTRFGALYAPGLKLQGPWTICPNTAKRLGLLDSGEEISNMAIIDTPGPNTTYVAVGGHWQTGLHIISHPSTSGEWSASLVKSKRVPGSDARFSFWITSDGRETFFWLSTLGVWAVKTDGSVLWKREEAEFRLQGRLVYGGGRLLYYNSQRVYLLAAGSGAILGNYSIPPVRARYSPSNDAFIVVAANGTVYRIASPPTILGVYGGRVTDYILLDGAGSARIEDERLYVNDTPTDVTGVRRLELVDTPQLPDGERAFAIASTGPGGTFLTIVNGGTHSAQVSDYRGSALAVHDYDNGTVKVAAWRGFGFEEYRIDLYALLMMQEKDPFVAAQGWSDETWVTITSRRQAATFVFDRDGQAPGSAVTEVVVKLGSLEQSGQPERLNLLRDVSPLYVDFYSASGLFNWMKMAEASSFWNTSLRNGLTVNVRLDGYWYSTLYSVADSVPVASLGIFWLYEEPINTADYEEARILANIQGPGMDTRTDAGIVFGDLVLFFSSSIGFYKLILKPVVFELPKILTRSTSGEVVRLTLDTSRRTIDSAAVSSKGQLTISRLMDAVRSLIKRGVPGEKATGAVANAAREAVKQDIAARVSKDVYTKVDEKLAYEMADAVRKAMVEMLNQPEGSDLWVAGNLLKESWDEATALAIEKRLLPSGAGPMDLMSDAVYHALRHACGDETTVFQAADVASNLAATLVENAKKDMFRANPDRLKYLVDLLRITLAKAAAAIAFSSRAVIEADSYGLPPLAYAEPEVRIDRSAFAAALTQELVKLGVPQGDAERWAREAAQYADVVYVRTGAYTLTFEVAGSVPAAVANIAVSFFSSVALKMALSVESVAIGSIGGAALAAAAGITAYLLTSQLVYAITGVMNDLQTGVAQQGAYAMGGLVFEIGIWNDQKGDFTERGLIFCGESPDVLISLVRTLVTGASYGKLSDWVIPTLEKWAKNNKYSYVQFRSDTPSDLKQLPSIRINKIGVYFMPIVWNRVPPPLSFQTYTATWTGRFQVTQFDLVLKRRAGVEVQATGSGADVEYARSIVVETEYGNFTPSVATEGSIVTARFALPKPATKVKIYTRDETRNARALVSFKVVLADRLRPLYDSDGRLDSMTGTIYNEGPVMVRVGELVFANLPLNKTPVGFYVSWPGAPGPTRYDVRDARVEDVAGGKKYTLSVALPMNPGESFVATAAFAVAQPPVPIPIPPNVTDDKGGRQDQPPPEPPEVVAGAAVYVRLNGTLRWATLPSMASVYITSTVDQWVNLTLAYSIEVEEGAWWVVVEKGIIEKKVRVFVNGNSTVRRSYDIESLVVRLMEVVRQRNETGKLFITATIEPEKDNNPIDNCGEDSAMITPAQLRLLRGTGEHALTVQTYDAITGQPVEAQVTVDGRSATAANGTAVFTLPAGTYTVTASAAGYQSASRTVVLNSNLTLLLAMLPSTATQQPQTGNATVPPVTYNGTVYVPLQVKVVTQDGYPVFNATVYVNGTEVGFTDAWGTWLRYYPNMTTVNVYVHVAERNWTSETRTALLTTGLAMVFLTPWRSNYTLPEVALLDVRIASYMNLTHMAGESVTLRVVVITSVPQKIRIKVGFLRNGTDAGSRFYNVTLPGVGQFPLLLPAPVNASGRLRPYAEIVWWENDTVAENNRVVGEEMMVWRPLLVDVYVLYDFRSMPPLPSSILFPELSNVTVWVVVRASREVDFQSEFGAKPVVKLEVADRHIGPAVVRRVAQVEVGRGGLNRTVVYSFNFTVPWTRFITINLTPVFEYSVFTRNVSLAIEVPTHFIVQGGRIMALTARPGDKVGIEVRAWSNMLPGEEWTVTFGVEVAGVAMPSLEQVGVKPGWVTYRVSVLVPEVKMGVFEPAKTVNASIVAWPIPDAYPGDNSVQGLRLTVLNTQSWVFWALVVAGIIVALLILLLVVNIFRALRSATVALRSPYLTRILNRIG